MNVNVKFYIPTFPEKWIPIQYTGQFSNFALKYFGIVAQTLTKLLKTFTFLYSVMIKYKK